MQNKVSHHPAEHLERIKSVILHNELSTTSTPIMPQRSAFKLSTNFFAIVQLVVVIGWTSLITPRSGMAEPASEQQGQATPRPNLVILMADNWAWPHAHAYGDPVVQTPTFDRLAREGVLFRNAFCLAPSCAPARAAFLTGQTIHRLGDAANLHGYFSAHLRVFTEAMEESGYFVGFSGKGWGPGKLPVDGRTQNPAGKKFASPADFVEQLPPDRPFCYWYSSRQPHIPWQDGQEMKAAMDLQKLQVPAYLPDDPVVRSNIADYLCEVQRFDQECADLLKQFDSAKLLENTLVVMTGDNGWQMPHGLAHIYDAGTRIPLVMRWPEQIAAGSVRDDFVNFDDFAPTFLELAGLEVFPECTGQSLMPVLKELPDRPLRDHVFLSRERHANVRRGDRSYPVRAIRTKDFLYVRNFEPDLWPSGDPEVYFAVGEFGDVDFTWTKQFILANRTTERIKPFFELNFGKRPAEELYDLAKDPDQTINVAFEQDYLPVRDRLRRQLAGWMEQTADPRSQNPHDSRWDRAPYLGGKANQNQVPAQPPTR